MRPHVLYVTPIFGYPAFGGPRLRTYNTLQALARCAEVSLYLTAPPDTSDVAAARAHVLTFCRDVVFPEPDPYARPPSGLRAAARSLLPSRLRAAIRHLRAAIRKHLRVPWAAVPTSAERSERDHSIAAGLYDWIQSHQPDVLWLGFGGISYDLVPLKQQTGKPLVLETECVWSRFLLRELPFAADASHRQEIERAGRAKEDEERRGAPLVDITTAVSDVDAAYFRSLVPDAGRVMRLANVIDVNAYQAPAPTKRLEQPALLFAGTLSHGTANVDATCWLVDQVLPTVWQARPDVHVYVVGRSPAPEVLARRGGRVHVTGEVASIVPFMRASRAALVPLRWESGTRFKILEAFACRTPVVSTSLGAEGLAVEHGRHLLLADDPAAFARAILALVEDPALGRRLAEPAFALVRAEYDLSSAERQIESILARLGVADKVAG